MPLPAGGTRVDLTGKTVIPALVSAHMHVGLLDGKDFGPQVYTHDKIVEHLERYAYYGIGAVFSMGTDVGPVSFEVARRAAAARRRPAHRRSRHGHPRRRPGHPVDCQHVVPDHHREEGRQRVRELKPSGAHLAIKIRVDDRDGRVKKLTPDLYPTDHRGGACPGPDGPGARLLPRRTPTMSTPASTASCTWCVTR